MSFHTIGCHIVAVAVCGMAVADIPSAIASEAKLRVPDLTPVAIRPAPVHEPIPIVKDGHPVAVVYVAVEPTPTLQLLIDELITVIKLSTGATLDILNAPPPAGTPAIVIGDCRSARRAGIDPFATPIEGFVVKTSSNRVFLVGSIEKLPLNRGHNDPYSNEGTAWAVADFLERLIDVRWYFPLEAGGRTVTRRETIMIPPLHYSDHPVFRKRLNWPLHEYRKPWQSRWTDKEHPVPSPIAIPPELDRLDMRGLLAFLRGGNSWPYLIKVHQPDNFRRDIERWKAHEAMFARREDGSTDYRMLCYSSQEAYDFLMRGCEEWWDEGKRTAAWVTETCVTISPTDYVLNCRCSRCIPKYDAGALRFGIAGGQASRLMGEFVLRFALEVQQRWPEKKVLYLPYWNYALYPEGFTFPDNLEIEMCTTGFPTYRNPGLREGIDKSLRTWSEALNRRIASWEYSVWVANWTHAPFQYPNMVVEYYRANRDVLVGSFINGGFLPEWSTTAPTLYIWMKTLWNPDIDVESVYDTMCQRLFGNAHETTRALLQLMTDRWEKAAWRSPLPGAGRISTSVFVDTWPPDVVEEMIRLRETARKQLENDPIGLQRLEYWLWTFDPFLDEAREVWEKAGNE